MKKTAAAFILFMAAFCVYAQNGIIREISGTVELKAPGSSSFALAKTGDALTRDTVISTGFKSTALVEAGSSYITVRPLTRLTLTELQASAGGETISVNLQAGRVRVDVNPPAGTRTSMAVTSPIATASVRGTSFIFDTRNLEVNHGTVDFLGNRGKPMLISAGSGSRIKDDGKAEDPIKTRSGRLKPQAPVGKDPSGGITTGTAKSSSGIFTIDIDYSQIPEAPLGDPTVGSGP